MKFKKNTAMLVSFTLGTLLLATTALADIASKSGYDEFKDALKVTAEQTSEKFDSFTLDYSIAVKDNGKILMTSNETSKFDRIKGASEGTSSGVNIIGENYSSQTYSDKMTSIRVSNSDPTYYVTEFTNERKDEMLNNPFKEEEAADIEKIADALVGSLKDHVVVKDNTNGTKGLEGSLSEVQIPSLVNALASFQLKQELNNNRNQSNMPRLTKDVFVKEVTGTAQVNKDGVMESILGTAVLSGKDEQGIVHDISIEILVTLTNINSTMVTKPDLTGKNVVKNVAKDYSSTEISNPKKYVGRFKNDVLIEKDGKFVKIGERFIDITNMDNTSVAGRYYEEYKPGFEEYETRLRDFQFNAQFEKDQRGNANFEYTNESGGKMRGNIYINDFDGKINFNIDNLHSSFGSSPKLFDSSFSPDLD